MTYPNEPTATSDAGMSIDELWEHTAEQDKIGEEGEDWAVTSEGWPDSYDWQFTPQAPSYEDCLSTLQHIVIENPQQRLLVPNYPEDEAVRHATLDAASWHLDSEPPFYEHGQLEVQLRNHTTPMPIDQAQEALERCGERTLVTLRIALGLWNLRRADPRLSQNGDVAILADELLHWLGIEKHAKVTGQSRRTDGWRPEEYVTLERDLRFAESLWVYGTHRMTSRGQHVTVSVDGSYINVTFIRSPGEGFRRLRGLFLSPGGWINVYHEHELYYLTPLTRRIFNLHPQNDQHALRLALFLAERWRRLSSTRVYDTPIVMDQLLRESAIAIPDRNRQRFATRIETALTTLRDSGVIGQYKQTGLEVKTHAAPRFSFQTWLASEWMISPPDDIITALNLAVQPRRRIQPRRSRDTTKRAVA